MGKRPGAKYAAVQHFETLMADGEKRADAKAEAQRRGESLISFTDGKIHSFETREGYQKIVMRFIDWCRQVHAVRDLEIIRERADELVSWYLMERIGKGYSAWTLTTERSALRMFFGNRQLASRVELPKRRQKDIKRSRYPAARDKHFQPENWRPFIDFCHACGLRREELRDLHVRDVYVRPTDQCLVVRVIKGKGGKWREVPVFPGREQHVLSVIKGRDPDAHVFDKLPDTDIHSFRRQFAQDLYELRSGRPLPPKEGRLQSAELDKDAALYVSRCLGHNRIDIIFGNYIR